MKLNLNNKALTIFLTSILSITLFSSGYASSRAVQQRHPIEEQKTSSNIVHVDSLDFLVKEEKNLDENSLVIFDVGKVLLMEAEPLERGYEVERKRDKTVNSLFSNGSVLNKELDRTKRDKLWSIYAKSIKMSLIDPNAPKIIKELQRRAKVMCLTSFFTGRIGVIPSMDDFRIKELNTLGLDFSSAFPKRNNIIFELFSYEGKHPVFKDGILFTTLATSKGELLKVFLAKINFVPNKVIMIDDSIKNLESVEQYLAGVGIPFKGYKYTAYSNAPKHYDQELAEFQMRYLLKHEIWLNAESARRQLNEEKTY